MQKITTCAELERVHLRFLKVPDNLKLSEILSKLLPSILSIYFEPDFHNLAASSLLESPKMKALEEVINHLITKTNNSKSLSKEFNAFKSLERRSWIQTPFRSYIGALTRFILITLSG